MNLGYPIRIFRTMAAIAMPALLIPALPCAKAAEVKATTNAAVLHTRTFKLDVNGLYYKLQNMAGKQSQTTTNFGTLDDGQKRGPRIIPGIDTEYEIRIAVGNFFNVLGIDLAPPKGFAFYERESLLTVRATDEDLEIIEQIIQTLTNYPPEVQITVRTYELGDEAFSDFQLEWLSKLGANKSESFGWMAGILTVPGFKAVLKSLEEKHSKDFLNTGEVTTLSGRQASFTLREPISDTTTNSGATINFGEAKTPLLEFDVVPYVVSDGYTMQVTLIPTATETVGPNWPTNSSAGGANGGIPITGQLPLPRSRVRQVIMSCMVWDGQTAVFVLKPPYAQQGKFLVVFVTSVIIDPSGNRRNSAESLPFAEKAVPPQTQH